MIVYSLIHASSNSNFNSKIIFENIMSSGLLKYANFTHESRHFEIGLVSRNIKRIVAGSDCSLMANPSKDLKGITEILSNLLMFYDDRRKINLNHFSS